MKNVKVRAIIFQHGGLYIAQGLEYDIFAQGTRRAEVEKAFGFVLAGHCQTSLEREEEAMAGVPEAPRKFFRMWEEAEATNK